MFIKPMISMQPWRLMNLSFEDLILWSWSLKHRQIPKRKKRKHLSLGSWYVSPVALTSNLVPWWWALGICSSGRSLVSEPFFSCRIFVWETTASSWNRWLSRWAITAFQERKHPGSGFCWGDVCLDCVATIDRTYLRTENLYTEDII